MLPPPAAPPRDELPWRRQPLHVPREDGSVFALPPLAEVPGLAAANRAVLDIGSVDVQGRSLERLRAWTRERVLDAASGYTSRLLGQEPTRAAAPPPSGEPGQDGAGAGPLFVAGHQPSLFHPGVWVKNFAIHDLAVRTGGTALNLVIDSDLLATRRIRVPAGTREHPTFAMVAWDEDQPPEPWEEARIANRRVFDTFGSRVAEAMAAWRIDPLAAAIGPDALAPLDRPDDAPQGAAPGLVRDALTAARHRLERRWGRSNLELPLSRLCELDPFLWFASHVLAHLPRFQRLHNDVLAEYRRVNRVRSRTHPVPELRARDGWLEAPFRVWRAGDRQRGRVYARQAGREVWLSDGADVFCKLRLAPDMDACCAVEALRGLPARGIRLRTRALTTTLFARLFLADLFVHGIGGAKYDEMTDHLIARFFGISPPAFLTLSATVHLPLGQPFSACPEDERRLRRLLRDLDHNPDRHLGGDAPPETHTLISEKQQLIAEQQEAERVRGLSRRRRRERSRTQRQRYRRLREINKRLAEFTSGRRAQLEHDLAALRGRLAANAVLQDREFSFALFPAETLRPFLTRLPP